MRRRVSNWIVGVLLVLASICLSAGVAAETQNTGAVLPELKDHAAIHAIGDFARYRVEVSVAGIVSVLPKSKSGAGDPFVLARLDYRRYDKGRRRVVAPELKTLSSSSPATVQLTQLTLSGSFDDGFKFSFTYRFASDDIEIFAPSPTSIPIGLALSSDFHQPAPQSAKWRSDNDYDQPELNAQIKLHRSAEVRTEPLDRRYKAETWSYRSPLYLKQIPYKEISIKGPWETSLVAFSCDRNSELRIIQDNAAKALIDGYSVKLPLSKVAPDGKSRANPQVLRIRIR